MADESYLPKNPFPSWKKVDQEACLVTEALCRVIAGAQRFQTITEAWAAMLNVERLRKQIHDETVSLSPSESGGASTSEAREGGERDG